MTAARIVLAALALLLVAAVPAGAAQRSTARLVAVTSPPPEHLADPGLKTYVYRFGPHRIGPYRSRPTPTSSALRPSTARSSAWTRG